MYKKKYLSGIFGYLFLILCVIIGQGCNSKKSISENDSSYSSSIQEWHQERIELLKSKNGVLSVVGLYGLVLIVVEVRGHFGVYREFLV